MPAVLPCGQGQRLSPSFYKDGADRVWCGPEYNQGSNFHWSYLEWDSQLQPMWTASHSSMPKGLRPITIAEAADSRYSVHEANNFIAHLHAQAFPMGAECEPQDCDGVASFSIPFSRLPTDTVIRGPRYRVEFDRVPIQ